MIAIMPRAFAVPPSRAVARAQVAALVVAAILAAGAAPARAQFGPQSSSQQHALVSLVAEQAAAVPGQPLALGLHFEIDPHWHIYWVNPGDSGGPPAIEWKLPPGFEASAFEWPVPQRIPIGDALVNYGYEVDVLLPLTVHIPASARTGASAELAGRVRYLICSDLCVPARADFHLTIPVATIAGGPSPAASLFAQTRPRIPKPAPATWRVQAAFANHQFDLTLDTGKREATAQFFPLVAGQIDDSAPQPAAPTARGVRLTLRASSQLTAAPRTLSGVIVLPDGRAFTIDPPVR